MAPINRVSLRGPAAARPSENLKLSGPFPEAPAVPDRGLARHPEGTARARNIAAVRGRTDIEGWAYPLLQRRPKGGACHDAHWLCWRAIRGRLRLRAVPLRA